MKTMALVLLTLVVNSARVPAGDDSMAVLKFREAVVKEDFTKAFQHLLDFVELVPRSDEGRQAIDYMVSRSVPLGIRELTPQEARYVAAMRANTQCLEDFQRSPFCAGDYGAVLVEGRWVWGKVDPAGKDGYSARVTMDVTGSSPSVKVYLSTDQRLPEFRELVDPPIGK